jgi:DNA topoisomerase-1
VKLIVVESPAKARTIEKFLGEGYKVAASYGHIRDLPEKAAQIPSRYRDVPWKRLAVNVDDDFEPIYVVSPDSRDHVGRLKKLIKQADELLLATDEDREGEAISWHLMEVLNPEIPVRRITFHEITRTAIRHALENPREIDDQLVRAQESRRILDRLYGYELSPVLWRRVRSGLSAGRVQSVAVRLIVEREEERQRFVVAEYYDVEALLYGPDGTNFTARLQEVDGQRLAGGKDFDDTTGQLKHPDRRLLLGEELAEQIQNCARSKASLPWRVDSVERKQTKQSPRPPFVTSTMQQAASNRLKMSPSRAMRIAQRLYEGVDLGGGERVGLITYMRTDSLTLSNEALGEAERFIRDHYGAEYSDGPRRYRTKAQGAQEAHEAIRPTSVERTPDSLAPYLDAQDLALYRLIWNRTVASQMTNALLDKTTVTLSCQCDGRTLTWRANGSIVTFPGFLRLETNREGDSLLPDLNEGQLIPDPDTSEDEDAEIQQGVAEVRALRHETSPPARYTEASLVRKLEEEGIGRPSTYASIISTIQNRGYVEKKSSALLPTYVGMAVTHLLRDHFPRYVDVKFTAGMEQDLDAIARGEKDWREFLARFYRGGADDPGLARRIADELEKIEYPAIPVGKDPETGEPLVGKIGKRSVYVQKQGADGSESVTLPVDLLIDELTPEKAGHLLAEKRRSLEPIGTDPETGKSIYALIGPYGPYLQLGENDDEPKPKRVSLGRGTDLSTVDLELALRLLSLPRDVGTDPATGKPVRAGLGRYGPYVMRDRTYANVESADQLFTITLDEALRRIHDKESGKKPTLAEVGEHPQTGATISVLKGRYGPYVTDGEANATLPRDREPDSVTVEEAVAWLAEAATRKKTKKKAKKKATKKTTKKKTAKKTTKKTAKKAARKKTTKSAGKSGTSASHASTDGSTVEEP